MSSRSFYFSDVVSLHAFRYLSPRAHGGRADAERGAVAGDRDRDGVGAGRRARRAASDPVARRASGAQTDGVRVARGERATPRGTRTPQGRQPLPRAARAPSARPREAGRDRLSLPQLVARRPRATLDSALLVAGGVLLLLVGIHQVREL